MSLKIDTIANMEINQELVIEFYEKYWTRQIALTNKQFYNWQFKSIPSALNIDNCVIAYDEDRKKLAGVIGINARQFSLNNEWKLAAELTSWIVHNEYKGLGIGSKIIDLIQKSYDIIIGMGISSKALSIYMQMGFRYLRAIPRFIKVFDMQAIIAISKQDTLSHKIFKKFSTINKTSFVVKEGINEKFNSLHDRIRMTLNLSIRDIDHLRWRYEHHPFFKYKMYTIKSIDSDDAAFVCIREELSVESIRILHVLDCFGDEKAIPMALAFIEQYCQENNFHFADFFCTAAKINKFLLSSGWFSILDDECFQIPYLYHPIEMRVPPTNSLIYWSKDNFAEMCDFSNLYITKQDADFDRPVFI